VNVPVLLLTALGEAQDRIKGLQSGADDYLPKPFEPEELLLRLKAILRRSMVQKKRKDEVRIGPWVFDGGVRLFSEDGEELGLTATEVSLLQALAGKNGDVMSRDDLAEACGLKASERSIDVQVTRLRRKIEDDSKNPRHLLTVRGKGYLLRTN
jgi:two-component system phosphate regulon response regulator OmpR